jgi:D-sedoheptulose 7-phosphate isomerase
MRRIIKQRIRESISTHEAILQDEKLQETMERVAGTVMSVISSGGRILLCGNGGSASDALHIAGELVGRFQKERSAWSAIALNADVATMTAVANDYGYEEVFARQVLAHIRPGDLLIAFSASGNSENVCRAVQKARELGGTAAVLTGNRGGRLKEMADFSIVVPDSVTARIQECHILIGHIVCELVEKGLSCPETRAD